MKPAPFEYYAPRTVDEALTHLAEHGTDAKALAGGQSLIPMMNFRLAQPSVIVDLNNIPELFYIHPGEYGGVNIGAMTRQYQIERSQLIAQRAALITEVMPMIATMQIRSRGTFGGSLAHADPSAELTAVSVALDSRLRLRGQKGDRRVKASEFFVGLFATLLEPEELLLEVEIPVLPPRTGWSFQEVARRPHDFALVGVAILVTLDEMDVCRQARVVLTSVGDGPVEARQAANTLIGEKPSPEALRVAAEMAATVDIDPVSDIHATAGYRRHLVRALTRRSLDAAFERAKGGPAAYA